MDNEAAWQQLRDATYSASADVLGFVKRKNHNWFYENDKEITELLERMYGTHNSYIANKTLAAKKSSYLNAKHIVQIRLRQMKDSWWDTKAQDKHNTKLFYEGLRAVYGPKSSGSAPIRSSDGKTLHTDKAAILTRWAEHFNTLLNRPSLMSEEALNAIPQRQVLKELDLPPSLDEVTRAIRYTSSGKSPGADGIPAEIYKHGGAYMRMKLTQLFTLIWDKGTVPPGV